MAQRDMVMVTWHDAHAESTWMSVNEIDDEPFVVETVGWLIPDSKPNHLVVGQSIGLDDAIDGVLSIPLGMVVKVQVLSSTAVQLKEGFPSVA